MRGFFLFLTLACLAVAVVPPRAVHVRAFADDSAPRDGTQLVFKMIERAAAIGDPAECETLSPLPLYELAPALSDWKSYCKAMVEKDPHACHDLDATIDPDLHRLCLTQLSA